MLRAKEIFINFNTNFNIFQITFYIRTNNVKYLVLTQK
jgi:hypothetical protein